jgi:peptidoglycan/LPS O-acetylase OafA/YrhL
VRPEALSPAASAHLDLVRGIAALLVMCGHLRALFFVDFRQLESTNPVLDLLYFTTGLGHQAVILFFVLSGFLISSAIFSRQATGTWSWRNYAIDRSSRLYAVLVPGLLLGLFWDTLGLSTFAATGLYSRPLEAFGPAVAHERLSIPILLGNLLFLQTIACPTFGSNGPLWSLANEFWYYLLFPVLLGVGHAWRANAKVRAVVLSMLGIAVAVFVGWHVLKDFPVWLVGTVLVAAHTRRSIRTMAARRLYLVVASLSFCAILVAARVGLPIAAGNLALGAAFGAFLLAVLQSHLGGSSVTYTRVARWMAGFSYSLYVLHFPILLFARAWLVPAERWRPDGLHLTIAAAVGVGTLAFAWLVSLFTEHKTDRVRQWIRSVTGIEKGPFIRGAVDECDGRP